MTKAGTNFEWGTTVERIIQVAKDHGFNAKAQKMSIRTLKKYLDKKIPVILPLQAWREHNKVDWGQDWESGHFVVAIGYTKDRIYFEDPSSISRTYLKWEELPQRWHDIDENGKIYRNFGLVITPKTKLKKKKTIHMD